MDIVEFLRARLDEDGAWLRVPMSKRMIGRRIVEMPLTRLPEYMAKDRKRWQREVEAKRRIVDICEAAIHAGAIPAGATWTDDAAGAEIADRVLRSLALPYADHPAFREEWRA